LPKGHVFLVGAGPGDPKLLTLKGSECIAQADVLVYDRLVSKSLLDLARQDAELIYAGKSPEGHTLKQEEINQVLIATATLGKTVTRLKGGDPFVFGRGGEEAEALAEAGIPFEIVPGITSAVAVPAYAGIPVTHRDFTSSFTVITGHEKPDKNNSALNWEALAQLKSTLIFLMGMENLELICNNLMDNGLEPSTPVGLIQWGTRSEQRVLTGCLADIALKARQECFTNPAVIIVGQVVSLRDKLKWLEHKPLFGRRIIVTRARHQASALSQAIAKLGGEPLEFPVIALSEPSNPELLRQAIREVNKFSWLIFTSVNGVEAFFQQLRKLGKDIRELAGIELAAIGPATREALEQKGLKVAYVPEEYRAERIAQGLADKIVPGQKILLARAEEAREVLPEELISLGAEVFDVPAYKTVLGETDKNELIRLLKEHSVDAVTFTSSSTVRNFLEFLDGNLDLLKGVTTCSIGPITSETAVKLGLPIDYEAAEYTIEGLIKALLRGLGND
jgi:uroporphyrinogen III methyltransferase/synthase